jgi:hypothetical protein
MKIFCWIPFFSITKKKGYDNEELVGVYYGQGLFLKRQIKVRDNNNNLSNNQINQNNYNTISLTAILITITTTTKATSTIT